MKPQINRYYEISPTETSKLDPVVREKLILKYAPLVKYIANRMPMWLPPYLGREELESAGILGLMDALEKFDEEKGIKFETYAEHRIRGAILDEIRKMDWVPRSVRKDINKIDQAYRTLRARNGVEPNEEKIAEELGIDLQSYHQMLNRTGNAGLVSLNMIIPENSSLEFLNKASDTLSPADELRVKELKQVLADGISKLSKNEQLVLSLYYYEELTFKEIANVLSLTESRISQIHSKALIRLRKKVRTYNQI